MPSDLDAAFRALKEVFVPLLDKLVVSIEDEGEYTLVTQKPSLFPQHKGAPMFFGSVRKGKSYSSLHLFPLYVCPELKEALSAELLRRMQGKSCFNFKTPPTESQKLALFNLAVNGMRAFQEKGLA